MNALRLYPVLAFGAAAAIVGYAPVLTPEQEVG